MDQQVSNEHSIKKQLISFLEDQNAHASFNDSIKDLPEELRSVKPAHLPYSIWQIVEHIRIVQWDVLGFSKSQDHKSPKWPDEYWPKETAPKDEKAWQASLSDIKQEKAEFIKLLKDTSDIHIPFPWGNGQDLFREALLIIDHTSYHTGEIIVIRRFLDAWK